MVRKFIYGPGIDEPIIIVVRSQETEVSYFYHFDGLGSVVALSDANAMIVEKYSYDVFGNVIATECTENTENPYFFTARRLDDETGLYYYRARYYKPGIGRFLQPDPIRYDGGLNLYSYVKNEPVSITDPFGLFGKCGPGEFWGVIIPDFPFSKCCEEHDNCYTGQGSKGCKATKELCDLEFCDCMWDKCSKGLYKAFCLKADLFCIAVIKYGQDAFDNARSNSDCCK